MLKVLLVDDEALAIKRMRKLLKPFVDSNRIVIHGEASDGPSALELLNNDFFDLVFLDIRMPEMDGFTVLERISPGHRPAVIFTTAFDEYAIKGFEANAVDYLLKPVSAERLDSSIARAERLHSVPESKIRNEERLARLFDWLDEPRSGTASRTEKTDYLEQVTIPYRDRLLVVPVAQIMTVEVQDGITKFFVLHDSPDGTKKLNRYMVNHTLEELEEKMNPSHFMRVHRSAIINLTHIREMVTWFSGRYKLIMETGHEVIASRERSKLLKKRLSF